MSAIAELSDSYDYDPHAHDFPSWWEHHRALIAALEPAKWSKKLSAKLSDEDVLAIRVAYAEGRISLAKIAASFDVTPPTIQYIVTGLTHIDIGGPLTFRGQGKSPPNRHSA